MERARIAIASSYRLLSRAIGAALAGTPEFEVVAEVHDRADLVARAAASRADVVLLDAIPDRDLAASVERLLDARPDLRVVLVADRRHAEAVRRSRAAGAAGCLPRDVEPHLLAQRLRAALEGSGWEPATAGGAARLALTEREELITIRVARGCSNKQIARELALPEHTVKFHLRNVYRKLGVANRTQLAAFAAVHLPR
jgi:DNA-binding NarL/FixJ family response regulator